MVKKNSSSLAREFDRNSEGGNVIVSLDAVHYKKYLFLKSVAPDSVSEQLLSSCVDGLLDRAFVAQKEKFMELNNLMNTIE